MLAQPGFRSPDQVDLGGGFMQRLEFYDRQGKPFVHVGLPGQGDARSVLAHELPRLSG